MHHPYIDLLVQVRNNIQIEKYMFIFYDFNTSVKPRSVAKILFEVTLSVTVL